MSHVGDTECQICVASDHLPAQKCDTTCITCNPHARTVSRVTSDDRHRLGRLGEQLAADHLERRGFQIVERNYRSRWGELDIIAYDGRTLAFCEVKTRRLAVGDGHPFDAIRARKRARLRKLAESWLRERRNRPHAVVVRFDAIGVTFDRAGRLVRIEHLEAAF